MSEPKKYADHCPCCPQVGDVFTCTKCGFSITVSVACTCKDCCCVCLACCGAPMARTPADNC